MKKMKKVLALIVAVLMMFPLATSVDAESATSTKKVDINKTATELDKNDESTVELTIGSTESKEKVAVMFLLDKSTSQGMRDEAAKMLDELATKMNTDILYNVVIFSGTATSTDWKNIQDSQSLEDTKNNFVNKKTTSGTNMDAGIEEALKQMKAIPSEYANAEKYLVTLSDGITYVWIGEDGQVKCVPIQGLHDDDKVETQPQNGADTWSMMYAYGMSLQDIYGGDNITTTISNFMNKIVAKMDNTKGENHVQDYYSDTSLENPISTYIYDDVKQKGVADKYATEMDFAIYESIHGYEQLIKQFDYNYVYAVPEANDDGTDNVKNWDNYPWGYELMEYLQSLSTNSQQDIQVSNANPSKIFASIKDQILYTIKEGIVTDVMGKDFDFKGLDTVKLTVGDEVKEGTINGDTITFGDYVVTYNKETDTLTWKINTPVEEGKPVKLSYVVKLVNKATEEGTYNVPTNDSAKLEYTTSTGDNGTEEFPVPKVSYVVEKELVVEEPTQPSEPTKPEQPSQPETPVQPSDPEKPVVSVDPVKPENTTKPTTETSKETQTDEVKTDDNSQVVLYGLVAALAVTGMGIIVANKKRQDLLKK